MEGSGGKDPSSVLRLQGMGLRQQPEQVWEQLLPRGSREEPGPAFSLRRPREEKPAESSQASDLRNIWAGPGNTLGDRLRVRGWIMGLSGPSWTPGAGSMCTARPSVDLRQGKVLELL